MRILAVVVLALSVSLDLAAELPIKAYPTALTLNGPLQPGVNQTLTGGGAPDGRGIYVELWRVAPGSAVAESVASVPASAGNFTFPGVDVAEGEHYYVTLSRSWKFDTAGNAEGWDQLTNHVALEVSGGTLNVTIGGLDPHFFNFFEYDARFYRVIEIRLRNPAVAGNQNPAFQDLGVYWGDFPARVNLHFAEIPSEMTGFETITIPLNVGEVRITPGPIQFDLDGLWATGLRSVLRIDPLDTTDPSAVGQVFQIDFIRLREDVRLDFHAPDDRMGIRELNDIADLTVGGGFLSYAVTSAPAVDPFFRFGLASGRIESGFFTGFAIGMDNPPAQSGEERRGHRRHGSGRDDDDDDDDHGGSSRHEDRDDGDHGRSRDDGDRGHGSRHDDHDGDGRDDGGDDDRDRRHSDHDDGEDGGADRGHGGRDGHEGHGGHDGHDDRGHDGDGHGDDDDDDDDDDDHEDDPEAPPGSVRLKFNDNDSGSSYTDDGGTTQAAGFPTPLEGRQDVFAIVDSRTTPAGEWTEDGRVLFKGLEIGVPAAASPGDRIRIDYIGIIPATPYGPSDPLRVEFPTISVEIDIRPGSDSNNVNPGSRGVLPVAVLSSPAFDALTVDPLTVRLAGAGVRLRGNGSPHASPEDASGDGLPDLLVHIETRDLELAPDVTEAVLVGTTFAGRMIRGADAVRIVP